MKHGRRMIVENSSKMERIISNKKEKKKKNIVRIFIIIAVSVLITIIGFIANDFVILDKNTRTNLVINNNNVTSVLKKDVLIENDIIYLSKQDIANFFDKYIYEEKDLNQIITTSDKKIAAIDFENNNITINGSNKKIYAHAIKNDNTIYLPISEMGDVYNIETQNIEDTKVVTIDSLDREQRKAIVSSDVSVKSSTNFIAKTVDRVKKGDTVIVISSDKGKTKIRTSNGKLGYINTDKIQNEYKIRENMVEEKQIKGKVNLVWDYYSEYASAPDRNGTSIEGLNVISPSMFYVDKNENLVEKVGDSGKKYIDWAHKNGYKVWPMVSNAEAGLEVTSKIMNSYKKRQELIEDIVNVCIKYNLDGINVDFENMKQEDKDLYSRFIIELTPRLKEAGLVISVDVTAPDGSETWSMCFDRNVIGHVADYIVFMAYDQYGASSTKPGTTAGFDWIKVSLNKFLKTEEIKPEKIILGIPFFTRVWTTNSEGKLVGNSAVAMKNIDKVIPESVKKEWDEDLKQNYVEFNDGNNKKQIWIEDIDSLKSKLSLVNDNNLAGVGSWQKDMESDNVWKMIKNEINK